MTAALRLRGYPVVLPKVRDPRLHLAAVIMSVQVLGQVFFGFHLSLAQWFLSLAVAGGIDAAIAFRRDRVIQWPASGLLTGNGVALVLRVPGTEHGDWWSLRGWWFFVGVSAAGIATKHLIRVADRPLFNPANVALVAAFVLFGERRVEPLDLWWRPWSPAMLALYIVLAAGGVGITWRHRLFAGSAGFLGTLAIGVGLLAATGHAITARWSLEPVAHAHYAWIVLTSPEVVILSLFMLTDPRTVPPGEAGRFVHGVVTGAASVLFMAAASSEFSTKVGLLAGLVVSCAARPLIERWTPGDRLSAWIRAHGWRAPVGVLGAASVLVVGGTAAVITADLVLSGLRPPTIDGVVAAERPDVEIGVLPPITLDDSLQSISTSIDRDDAERIVRDVLVDLAVERRALVDGDRALAASVLVSPRLDAALERIDAGDRAAPTYRIHSVRILLRRDTPQATPQVAVRAVATVDGRPVDTDLIVADYGHWYLRDELAR